MDDQEFDDGLPSNEPVDDSYEGFADIFGIDTEANDDTEEEATPQRRVAADESEPDEDDDDLSASDIVAANFAYDLEQDGIEIPDPEDDDEDDALAAAADDLDEMTPEQWKELAREALEGRGERENLNQNAIAHKVQQAEWGAVNHVRQLYQQNVLGRSKQHYRVELNERVSKLWDAAQRAEDPKRAFLQMHAAEAETVIEARRKWEDEQAEQYDTLAAQAAQQARKNVPELRDLYARELLNRAGLPVTAANMVLKTKSGKDRPTDDFEDRVAELADSVAHAAKQKKQANQELRKQANTNLRKNKVSVSPGGKPRGSNGKFKPKEYRGSEEEGLMILSTMHRS